MHLIRLSTLCGLAALILAGTASLYSEPNSSAEGEGSGQDKEFVKKLQAAAKAYPLFGRVDDEARWAPGLCREPMPAQARFSKSSDETTHGQKLYSLFAKDRDDYMAAPAKASPVGQVLIKESWVPEEVKARPSSVTIDDTHFDRYVRRDGKLYKASKLAGLYIMMKLDPKTPGTDEGWIYGTVSADGETVTSSGRVESCMKCHETKKERLFGLKTLEKGSGSGG
jgi:hypothetical protein